MANSRLTNAASYSPLATPAAHLVVRNFAMDDTPPDRLSNDPGSPFYNAEMLERGVGIRFKGVEKNNVEEYCVSEGWVRVAHATAKDRRGNPMTIKLSGTVEPYFRTDKPQSPD
jgi:hypothetical protein